MTNTETIGDAATVVARCVRCDQALGETMPWIYPTVTDAWLAAVAWGWLPLPDTGLVCHTCQAANRRNHCRVVLDHVMTAWEESDGLWHRTCSWCGAMQVQLVHVPGGGWL